MSTPDRVVAGYSDGSVRIHGQWWRSRWFPLLWRRLTWLDDRPVRVETALSIARPSLRPFIYWYDE